MPSLFGKSPPKWQDVLISLGWLDAISLAHCHFFFLVYSSPSVQQKALPASRSLGWLWIGLFVCPCRSESSRPTLCPCALSRWEWGLRLPAGSLFALAGNQSVSGGGMHGVEWEVMRLDASWGTPWLCAPSTLVFPEGRDQVYLTTSALSSTQRAPPDPDKICMCHNLQHDPTPCKPCHTPLAQFVCFGAHGWTLKTDMTRCYECDNINRLLKKINKAAVHSPLAQEIMFHDCSTILLRVTGTLLLSQRRLITLEATESKQAIIYQKTTLLLFYSP